MILRDLFSNDPVCSLISRFAVSIVLKRKNNAIASLSIVNGKPRLVVSLIALDQFVSARLYDALNLGKNRWNNAVSVAGKPLKQEFLLEWLILHELQHIELGHFAFADSFGIAQRRKPKRQPIDAIPQRLHPRVLPSLELQADHDATELLLGAYSTKGWDELRNSVLAISAMMVLIEIEEAKLDEYFQTHPKAATRIFQLLCHVAELPLIAAQLADDPSLLPDTNELEAFGREVTLPCYFDAVELATKAGAQSIQVDLGNPTDLFKDMEIVKQSDPSRYFELKTEGAKEWVQLWECNELLKPLQVGVHFAK